MAQSIAGCVYDLYPRGVAPSFVRVPLHAVEGWRDRDRRQFGLYSGPLNVTSSQGTPMPSYFECLHCGVVTPVEASPPKCGQCGHGTGVIHLEKPPEDKDQKQKPTDSPNKP